MKHAKPEIRLAFNHCLTNDPCRLCGARCDPVGLDFVLRENTPGRRLVCDTCAKKHAPELVEAQAAGLEFARFEREAMDESCATLRESEATAAREAKTLGKENKTLRELASHLLAALALLEPVRTPEAPKEPLPF